MRGNNQWIDFLAEFDPYELIRIKYRMDFLPGQIYWAPITYPLPKSMVILPEEPIPDDESKIRFRMEKFSKRIGESYSPPIKTLNLRKEEKIFAFKGKVRPFVTLAKIASNWDVAHSDKVVIGIPLFTFKDRHPAKFIYEVQGFMHPNLLYVKPTNFIDEGAMRFELLQFISKGEAQPYIVFDPKTGQNYCVKLSQGYYKILWSHLWKFLNGTPLDKEIEEAISAYRELIREKLEEL